MTAPPNISGRRGLYYATWSDAKKNLARAGFSAAEIEEERHLCHRRSLCGKDPSSNQIILDPDDLDAVLAEFRAIGQPDDLNAQLKQIDGSQDRDRLIYRIRALGLDDPYIEHIAQAQFRRTPWTSLPAAELEKLSFTLATRARRRRKAARLP